MGWITVVRSGVVVIIVLRICVGDYFYIRIVVVGIVILV